MLPEAFTARMRALLKTEYDAFAACYDAGRYAALRLNRRKLDGRQIEGLLGAPVPWAADAYYIDVDARPGQRVLHDAGLYYLQEPSAMAPAALLRVKPGEHVLDLCAAPGGKSTQLAAAMAGEGLLVCNEIHPKRAQILSSNIERMGISNTLVLNEHPARLAERFSAYFDKILVDAPCSGEGMFRKEPMAASEWTPQSPAICAARQLEILHSAAKMLRGGGRLVYSTCTFSPEENEGTISAFLRAHPEFSVESADAPWFSPGRPDWIDSPAEGMEKTFRLWPHKLHGEGHYAAVLRKDDGGAASSLTPCAGEKLPDALRAFCRDVGAAIPDGKAIFFGSGIYLAPELLPDLRGLKVLRAGLQLGQMKKDRFEPEHAWALWLLDAARTVELSENEERTAKYLAGEAISGDNTGWALVRVDGYSLGWVKGSNGQLKNHYPKALRRSLGGKQGG